MPNYAQRRSINPLSVYLWLAIAMLASSTLQFNWAQDIGAYADNIERHYLLGEVITERNKSFWYEYLVFPLWRLVGEINLTLLVIKSAIMALFFVSQRHFLRTHLDAAILIGIILMTPTLSENVVSYLRQGTAIGVFLLAMSFTQRQVRWPLIAFSLLQHSASFLLLAASVAGSAISKAFLSSTKRSSSALYLSFVGVTLVVTSFGYFGGNVIRIIPGANSLGFLEGNRSNIFAALYLASYASFVGFQSVRYRSVAHASTFAALLFVCGTYSAILDFGRALSLAVPLHLHASLTLPHKHARLMDQAVLFLASAALIFV